jgi:aminoglycoside phosphotransferase (APT) family kinase protein
MNQDPQLPHMIDALNPALMGPLLDWLLARSGKSGFGCDWQIGEKRYKPGKSLLVGYRLPTKPGNSQPRFATGRLYPPSEVNREFERERAKRPELKKGALTFLQQPAMLVWAFPFDRKLLHLPKLLDHEAIKVRMQAADLAGKPIQAIESEVLHYLAECSCMIRYCLKLAESAHPQLLYAKNYADDAGRETFSVMRQLKGQFSWGAEALAFDAETLTLWQSHLPGQSLSWRDLQAKQGFALADRIAQCVADLHACRIDTAKRFTQNDVIQGLLATPILAKQTRPEWAGLIERSVNSLLEHKPDQAKSVSATLHHDLKLNNFLLNGNRLGLIDMDCVCVGDPLADLASLIANIYLNGIRETASIESIHPLVNRLVLSYQRSSRHTVCLSVLRWQIAAALIHEVIRRSLRQMDEQRIRHIKRYLALSDIYAALSKHMQGADDVLI